MLGSCSDYKDQHLTFSENIEDEFENRLSKLVIKQKQKKKSFTKVLNSNNNSNTKITIL